jgi:hypothetical protein
LLVDRIFTRKQQLGGRADWLTITLGIGCSSSTRSKLRSFWQLSKVDAGYDTDGIFTFQIAANRPDLKDRASVSRFQYAFMDRLAALPGVESVGFVTTLPLDEGAGSQNITTPRIQAREKERNRIRCSAVAVLRVERSGMAPLLPFSPSPLLLCSAVSWAHAQ